MAESVLNQEEQKLNANGQPNKEAISKRNRIIGIALSIFMIGLTAYVFKLQHDNTQILSQSNDLSTRSGVAQASNYRSYVQQYKDTKVQLEETTRKLEEVTKQLDDVTTQLNTTKSMLNQTQTLLLQAQAENTKLKQDLQIIDGIPVPEGAAAVSASSTQNISELEAKIAMLKEKNSKTTTELGDLKTQLKSFQADFSTLEEGRTLIAIFQSKIKLVKDRMRHIAQEANLAKIAAQKERDRLAALNGNSGFLVRDGKPHKPSANPKNYSIDVKVVP